MNKRTGAKGALLDEYEKALLELKQVISDVSPKELTLPVDKTTTDQNCVSIQSILTHVVYAGYTYANYIRKLKKAPFKLWEKAARPVIVEYNNDLNQMFLYTIETFGFFTEEETMQPTNDKILSHWGQAYDIEQMWEHAIVHVLRHRRQIEKFKKTVR
jgi:hypothetical protein